MAHGPYTYKARSCLCVWTKVLSKAGQNVSVQRQQKSSHGDYNYANSSVGVMTNNIGRKGGQPKKGTHFFLQNQGVRSITPNKMLLFFCLARIICELLIA